MACTTPGFTCRARLNDRSRSDRTSAPCLVQAVVIRRGDHAFLRRTRTKDVVPPARVPMIAQRERGVANSEPPTRSQPTTARLAPNSAPATVGMSQPMDRSGILSSFEHVSQMESVSSMSKRLVVGGRLPHRSQSCFSRRRMERRRAQARMQPPVRPIQLMSGILHARLLAQTGGIRDARITPGFTCRARLNDRPRSGRTFAPCLVQAVVMPHVVLPIR